MKKAVLYARQSTKEQNSISQQFEDLERLCERNDWIVVKRFSDKETGTTENREEYQELLDFVYKGKADVVLVWKFDRFARSMYDLVDRLREFDERNVDFVSYHENIDTTNTMGKILFSIIAGFAELEAENIRRRVKRGMQNAKENGTKSGKPIGRPTLAEKEDVDLRQCIRLMDDMMNNEDSLLQPKHIQKRSGVSQPSYYRIKAVVDILDENPDADFDELYDETSAGKRLVKQIMGTYNDLMSVEG